MIDVLISAVSVGASNDVSPGYLKGTRWSGFSEEEDDITYKEEQTNNGSQKLDIPAIAQNRFSALAMYKIKMNMMVIKHIHHRLYGRT